MVSVLIESITEKRWQIIAAVTIILTLVVIASISAQLNAENPSSVDEESEVVSVETVQVTRKDIIRTTTVSGQLTPSRSVNLAATLNAEIEKINASVGDKVHRDQLLVKLDQAETGPRYQQSEAALKAAKAKLSEAQEGATDEEIKQLEAAVNSAEVAYQSAEWTFDQIQTLYERDAVPRPQLEEAKTQYYAAKSQLTQAQMQLKIAEDGPSEHNLQMLKAGVEEAQAAVDLAANMLSKTEITAPFAGLVSYVKVEQGEMVAAGSPVAGVLSLDPIEAEVLVSEKNIAKISRDDTAQVTVDAVDSTFEASVEKLSPAADPETGMFPVTLKLQNPDRNLLPGMLVEVEFTTAFSHDVLSVPRKAVLSRGDKDYVFVVKDNRAHERQVTIGLEDKKYAEIIDGLQGDESVVTYGAEYLDDGSTVNLMGRE